MKRKIFSIILVLAMILSQSASVFAYVDNPGEAPFESGLAEIAGNPVENVSTQEEYEPEDVQEESREAEEPQEEYRQEDDDDFIDDDNDTVVIDDDDSGVVPAVEFDDVLPEPDDEEDELLSRTVTVNFDGFTGLTVWYQFNGNWVNAGQFDNSATVVVPVQGTYYFAVADAEENGARLQEYWFEPVTTEVGTSIVLDVTIYDVTVVNPGFELRIGINAGGRWVYGENTADSVMNFRYFTSSPDDAFVRLAYAQNHSMYVDVAITGTTFELDLDDYLYDVQLPAGVDRVWFNFSGPWYGGYDDDFRLLKTGDNVLMYFFNNGIEFRDVPYVLDGIDPFSQFIYIHGAAVDSFVTVQGTHSQMHVRVPLPADGTIALRVPYNPLAVDVGVYGLGTVRITGVSVGDTIDVSGYYYNVTIPSEFSNFYIDGIDMQYAKFTQGGETITLLSSGASVRMHFVKDGVEYEVPFSLNGRDPFANLVIVTFPGMSNVVLQYNSGPHNAWVTVDGTFTDFAAIMLPDGNQRVRARVGTNILSAEVTATPGEGFKQIDIPVKNYEISGIAIAGLNIDVRIKNDLNNGPLYYRHAPYNESSFNFTVFDVAGQVLTMQLGGRHGFANVLFDLEETMNLVEAGYIYKVVLPGHVETLNSSIGLRNEAGHRITVSENVREFYLLKTGHPTSLSFRVDGRTFSIAYNLDGTDPFAGLFLVSFPGIENVRFTHYTNNTWHDDTPGVTFDNVGYFRAPNATSVRAVRQGMVYQVDGVRGVTFPYVINVPVGTITVTGIESSAFLSIVGQNWAYQTVPFEAGATATFNVFDNRSYELRISKTGFAPIGEITVNAGEVIDISDYFYTVEVPDGVTHVRMSSDGGWIVNWQAPALPVVDGTVDLLKTGRSATVHFIFDGVEYNNNEFILDGSNPWMRTVTFADWDGTVLKTEPVLFGGAATAPDDPYRAGFIFSGWSPDFSRVTGDLTIMAQYNVIYRVGWVADPGTLADPAVTGMQVDPQDTGLIPSEPPTRDGFRFDGWRLTEATSADGVSEVLDKVVMVDGSETFAALAAHFETITATNLTMVAQWSELFTVDKTALDALIAEAELIEGEDDYTAATWAALQAALAAAKVVSANLTATQAQVDAAAETLEAAIAGLTKVGVWAIGNRGYNTLVLAVGAVQNGETIRLLQDSDEPGFATFTRQIAFTIDTQGYNLNLQRAGTVSPERSLGVTWRGVSLTINGDITMERPILVDSGPMNDGTVASVTVNGNVTSTAGMALDPRNRAVVTVNGNVTASGHGVRAQSSAVVTVTGDITLVALVGTPDTGVYAFGDAVVTVGGNIDASLGQRGVWTQVNAMVRVAGNVIGNGTGALAVTGSTIIIDGTLTAAGTRVSVDNNANVQGTRDAAVENYMIYAGTVSRVLVFDPDWVAPGDKTALAEAIAAAQAITGADDYTPASWTALQEALAAAIVVNNNPLASQPEVDAALAELLEALDNLVYVDADYSDVDAAIAAASELDEALYESEALAAVDAAINAVVRGLDVRQQGDVDDYAAAIWDAIGALVRRAFMVRFIDRDGAEIGQMQIVLRGEAATAPEPPAVDGYRFSRWSADFSNVTEDLNVTALYLFPGDVDGDGVLTEQDISWLSAHIRGATPDGFIFENADVNGDGAINAFDLMMLQQMVRR